MPRQSGQFLVDDYFENTSGLNTADSPFLVKPGSCTGGANYDFYRRGAFRKRPGHALSNTTPDGNTRCLGLGLLDDLTNRSVIRSAGRKLQYYNPSSGGNFTNLTLDTSGGATSNIWASSTTVQTPCAMFTSSTKSVLWFAGGGQTNLYGAYSTTKATANGVPEAPVSAIAGSSAAGAGLADGTYHYTVVLHKASTSALGNAASVVASEATVSVSAGNNQVSLQYTFSPTIDTTLYDKVYVYRSATNGSALFTTGDLAYIRNSVAAGETFTDTGAVVTASTNVPRAGNTTLDNSPLPSGTMTSVVLWKRRLVTAIGSTLYLSDTNKQESWPTTNIIPIPSSGAITGLAVISLTSVTGATIDELLCVFKQRELQIMTGSTYLDWALKYVDSSGCPTQNLIASANGYIAWCTYRGMYMWDGSGKPVYISKTIEDDFTLGGDVDKSKLAFGVATFCPFRNEIEWWLSSLAQGEQKIVYKLDLKLTLMQSEYTLAGRIPEAVFSYDILPFAVYAGMCVFESVGASQETLYIGDGSGSLYSGYSGTGSSNADSTVTDIAFSVLTPYLHMGSPNTTKRFVKVVAWVQDNGVYNIELDWWTKYRFAAGELDSRSLPVSATASGASLTWDSGYWDQKYWDTVSSRIKPLVFNLAAGTNNNAEGTSLRLQFKQTGHAESPIIYGYSVYYTESAIAA